MQEVTVVIPNLNGESYLRACLDSLRSQSAAPFPVIVVDNGSADGSVELIRKEYPEVLLKVLDKNYGFCKAVNIGIKMTQTPYVILLNNDTVCAPTFVEALTEAIREKPDCFSCASKMVQMQRPDLMDNGGDYYCALGWAFAWGKGKPARKYGKRREIFSACAGAAIYRREVFDEIGLFDEVHFAYLEDVDVAYRAKIAGYRNYYIPEAVVRHVGSATSGSVYNEFKTRYSSRNSVYLIYKNMPWPQILLNLPFLTAGIFVKMLFFIKKGYGREYITGLWKGIRLCDKSRKVRFRKQNLTHYLKIQFELWGNILRRLSGV
ncbi:MAG: glycosyltransferase family 2 protein [Lachnospiraceae bacterium]|nr:glycosyltransferase family 2 protein [Lachnospiraceae bacterium]